MPTWAGRNLYFDLPVPLAFLVKEYQTIKLRWFRVLLRVSRCASCECELAVNGAKIRQIETRRVNKMSYPAHFRRLRNRPPLQIWAFVCALKKPANRPAATSLLYIRDGTLMCASGTSG